MLNVIRRLVGAIFPSIGLIGVVFGLSGWSLRSVFGGLLFVAIGVAVVLDIWLNKNLRTRLLFANLIITGAAFGGTFFYAVAVWRRSIVELIAETIIAIVIYEVWYRCADEICERN